MRHTKKRPLTKLTKLRRKKFLNVRITSRSHTHIMKTKVGMDGNYK